VTASRADPPVTPVAGRRVLFVMAAEQEYGPHLRARFAPLMTGVGPVEAGIAAAHALAHLRSADRLPDLVVSLGSAGSRRLEQTSVHQIASVSYRDMDASALGVPRGVTPFLGLPAVLDLPFLVPGVPAATLSSGANIVSGAAYDAIEADMVDMETYAVLRACQRFGVPLAGFRGISDGAAELRHVGDWTEYLHIVDEKLADAVDRLAEAVAAGLLDGAPPRSTP
jgi:adenosylhomocysteine nucleosidase